MKKKEIKKALKQVEKELLKDVKEYDKNKDMEMLNIINTQLDFLDRVIRLFNE